MRRLALPALLWVALAACAFAAPPNSVYAVVPGFEGDADVETAAAYVRWLGFDTLLLQGDFTRQAGQFLSSPDSLAFVPPEVPDIDYTTLLASAAHKAGLLLVFTVPTPPGGFAAEIGEWLRGTLETTGADGFLLSEISLLRPDQWAQIRQTLRTWKSDVVLWANYPTTDAAHVEGVSAEPGAYSAAGFELFFEPAASAGLRALVRGEEWNPGLLTSQTDTLVSLAEEAWALDYEGFGFDMPARILNRVFDSPDRRLAAGLGLLFLGPRVPVVRFGTEFPLDGPEGEAGNFPLPWQLAPRFASLLQVLNAVRAANPAFLENPSLLDGGEGWAVLSFPANEPLVLALNLTETGNSATLSLPLDLSAGSNPVLLEWLGDYWFGTGTDEVYTKFASPSSVLKFEAGEGIDVAGLALAREQNLAAAGDFANLPAGRAVPGRTFHSVELEQGEGTNLGRLQLALAPLEIALYRVGPAPQREPEPVYFIVAGVLLAGILAWGAALRARGGQRRS